MLEHLSFETSAVHAGGPQTAMKSFKNFSRLSPKKRGRAYVLMNQHGNGEAGAANEQTAVNLLAAGGLRVNAASFEPGKGQGKKMARRAVKSRKYDMLVMFGGDGSINKGVQAVVDADDVSLGVICGGTVNHVSRMFYGSHDSKQWWVNVLRLMQSAPTSVDVGTIEPHSVELVSGGTKRVPKALRKTAYFLLSASLGAHASIVALAPQRLKYMADQLIPGGGELVLLETGLTHLQELRPFAAHISNGNPADSWNGNVRAVIVANADYRWCPGTRIDDGKLAATGVAGLTQLVTGESDQAVLNGEEMFATVPCGTYLEIDGSLVDLVDGLARKLGPIQSVTYRYSTKKIAMLVPYTIPQPLLTNPVVAPPEPADEAPVAGETFFNGAQPMSVMVQGTAWLRASRWVIYGQTDGKSLAIRVTAKADVARSGPTSPSQGRRGAQRPDQPKGPGRSQARINHPAFRQDPALGHQGPESSYLTGNLGCAAKSVRARHNLPIALTPFSFRKLRRAIGVARKKNRTLPRGNGGGVQKGTASRATGWGWPSC